MARLSCANCCDRVAASDVVCPSCGAPLLCAGAVTAVSAPPPPSERPSEHTATSATPGGRPSVEPGRDQATDDCPHCHAPIPDPQNLVCLECLTELGRPKPAVDARGPRLRLGFGFGAVDLAAGEVLALGRTVQDDRAVALRSYDNVSRTHASVGVRADGTAWVRDEGSMNGTFVDGRQVPAGTEVTLTDGGELRLASNVSASVRLLDADANS